MRPLLSIASALRSAAALLVALALAGCGADVELFSNIAQRDANEIVASLKQADIQARKQAGKEGAVNLLVTESSVARAIAFLEAEGLPRERRSSMGDVFRKEGLISSPLEERARYLWALSQELAETVSQIDGVLRARVHVVLPERSTGGEPGLPSSAAVFVKHRSSVSLEETVPQIRRLVANSVPGLTAEKVSVVLVPSIGGTTANLQSAAPAAAVNGRKGAAGKTTPWVWAVGTVLAIVLLVLGVWGWRLQMARRDLPAAELRDGVQSA